MKLPGPTRTSYSTSGAIPHGENNQVKIIWSLYDVSNDFIFLLHYMPNLYTNNLYQSLHVFNIIFVLFSFLSFLTLLLKNLFVGFIPSNIL